MRKLEIWCLGVVVAGFIATIMCAVRPNADSQFLSMVLSFALLVLSLAVAIVGVVGFKRSRLRAFLPLGICMVGIPANLLGAFGIGGWLRELKFNEQLTRYKEVVGLVEKGEIKAENSLMKFDLPQEYADLAVAALAKKNESGTVFVEFIVGGGFPVKHSGYLYVSTGLIESDPEMMRRWPRHRKVADQWFAIAD